MLQEIFKYIYKREDEYKSYNFNNEKMYDCLKNRANIDTPSRTEIIASINKVLDMRLTAKDNQKVIEKMLVFLKGKLVRTNDAIFLWKQEHKMNFEIDHKDYIESWKQSIGKKSITIEDKNMLFRNFYKEQYKRNANILNTLQDYINTLIDEKEDIQDTKRLLNDYLNILNRII